MKKYTFCLIISMFLIFISFRLFAQSEVIYEFEMDGKKATVTTHQFRRLMELSNSVLRSIKPTIPTKEDIRQLANVIGLTRALPPNIQFRFTEREIEFWADQMADKEKLRLEFMARKAILEAAYFKNIVIPSEDDFNRLVLELIPKIADMH